MRENDDIPWHNPTPEEQIARHVATARREQPRDEVGRLSSTLPSPLAAWETPQHQPGTTARHGGGRMRNFTMKVPILVYNELKTIAEKRGVSINFVIGEALAAILPPIVPASSRGLTDKPLNIGQPNRIHAYEPVRRKPKGGGLIDRRGSY